MNDLIQDEGKAKAGFSSAEYNAVATSAHLGAINMLASNFSVNPDCLGDSSDWKLSYNRKVLSCSYNQDSRYVAAIFQYEVIAKLGRRKAMRCTADFGVYYTTTEDATEAAAIGFCRNTGSFAAYPYFRALVAQLAWNAGVTLPPLPGIASTAHIPKKQKVAEIEGTSNGN